MATLSALLGCSVALLLLLTGLACLSIFIVVFIDLLAWIVSSIYQWIRRL
jgi:hypothetical protein